MSWEEKVEIHFNASVITIMVLHDFHTNRKHFKLTLVSCSLALVSGKSGGEVVSLAFYKREREKTSVRVSDDWDMSVIIGRFHLFLVWIIIFCYTYGGWILLLLLLFAN